MAGRSAASPLGCAFVRAGAGRSATAVGAVAVALGVMLGNGGRGRRAGRRERGGGDEQGGPARGGVRGEQRVARRAEAGRLEPPGELRLADGLLLTRPRDVRIDPDGDLAATVLETYGVEDGLRVLLGSAKGRVWAAHPALDVRAGDAVRLSVSGGVRFALPSDGPGPEPGPGPGPATPGSAEAR